MKDDDVEVTRRQTEAAAKSTTAEDLVAYLHEKGASTDCMSCGKNSWHVTPPNEDGIAVVQILNVADVLGKPLAQWTPDDAIPAIVMLCTHCGFVRMHTLLPLADWKAKKEMGNE